MVITIGELRRVGHRLDRLQQQPWHDVAVVFANELLARMVTSSSPTPRSFEQTMSGICLVLQGIENFGAHPGDDAATLRFLLDSYVALRRSLAVLDDSYAEHAALYSPLAPATLSNYVKATKALLGSFRSDVESIITDVDFEGEQATEWTCVPAYAKANAIMKSAFDAVDVTACLAMCLSAAGPPVNVILNLRWAQIRWDKQTQQWFLALPRLDGEEGIHAIPLRWGADFIGGWKRINEPLGTEFVFPSRSGGPLRACSVHQLIQKYAVTCTCNPDDASPGVKPPCIDNAHGPMTSDAFRHIGLADWAARVNDPAVLQHVAYQKGGERLRRLWQDTQDVILSGAVTGLKSMSRPTRPGNKSCPDCGSNLNGVGRTRCDCGASLGLTTSNEFDSMTADVMRRVKALLDLGRPGASS